MCFKKRNSTKNTKALFYQDRFYVRRFLNLRLLAACSRQALTTLYAAINNGDYVVHRVDFHDVS